MASDGFQKRFSEMLAHDGFQPSDLRSATLVMTFSGPDEYCCSTTCRLETLRGKVFEKSSSTLG